MMIKLEIARFDAACNHLTEQYFAPVPSQFMLMPRAMDRTGFNGDDPEFSVTGYCRALAEDCIRWTGGGMDAPL